MMGRARGPGDDAGRDMSTALSPPLTDEMELLQRHDVN